MSSQPNEPTPAPEQNWAGSYTYRAPRFVAARTIDEVCEVVAGNERVRGLGSRHSFTDLPDTTGTLVSILDIDPDFVLDEEARTVSVGGGTRYGVLARWLDDRGWALHNMGSLPHISIAGANATGTHGSGNANGILATAISALEYVDASGTRVRVARGEPDFDGFVVGLGALGVVVRVTLDVQPAYLIRQDVYRGMSWDAALADIDALTRAGRSVSLFTTWTGEALGEVWVKSLVDGSERIGETLLDGHRDPVSSTVLADVVEGNLTEQGGAPGRWLERLPHFRPDAPPSAGDETQSEYYVPRSDTRAALDAVRAVGQQIRSALLVSEIRTAAADTLWLSPAQGRDVTALHFTWVNDASAVAAAVAVVEAALAPFEPRPHWGKVYGYDAAYLARVFPALARARDLFDRLDPAGKFSNEHLRRIAVRSM